MSSMLKISLALLAGLAIGAGTVQVLNAQAKPKAYLVTESQIIDAAVAATYGPKNQAAQAAAGGRSFRTTGKITAVVGSAPQRVGLSEWESVDKAQAWTNSEGRKALDPERAKAIKIIRQYIVEAAN
ncbi:MAG: DUF1330 domain-containing protein [Xanthobacteraceae bacterium]